MIDLSFSKLNENTIEYLLNPENPLLVKFKTEAPGTFQHCEKVRDLCEKSGRPLKLNLDVLKIIGMYHDIGKMWAPEYFSENQPLDHNIHDTLDPFVSKYFITSHVANTNAILVNQCPEMPTDLIRIMSMHHGNSVTAIYNKVKNVEGNKYTEEDFRYPYTKPDNIYSIILMACDVIEAKLKSLKQAGKIQDEEVPEEIIKTTETLFDGANGQLNDIKHSEGKIIQDVLISELGFVGKRTSDGYSSDEKNGKNNGKKEKNGKN